MNILFVCKWNRFRSKAGEAIFNKIYKNQKHHAKSAGIFPYFSLSKESIKTLNEVQKRFGIKFSKKQSSISKKLINWSDTIIVVAEDVPISIFNIFKEEHQKKLVYWKIKDVFGKNIKKRIGRVKEIESKIKALNLN
ncbi:hypothetical protein K0A97_00260 [Patescibacteria group bacterium]|nr:hypothetical protein [Patescibacteria group bacterium]